MVFRCCSLLFKLWRLLVDDFRAMSEDTVACELNDHVKFFLDVYFGYRLLKLK